MHRPTPQPLCCSALPISPLAASPPHLLTPLPSAAARQVKWLEGLIVLITVALAIGIGSCCMHAINTPTKFETPKETRAAGGHHE